MNRRASLLHLMGLVAVLACGMAAMKVATEGLARWVVLGSTVGLLVATVGAIVRRRGRPAWIGSAVFGWGYWIIVAQGPFLNMFFTNTHGDSLLQGEPWQIDDLADPIARAMHPVLPTPIEPFPRISTAFDPKTGRRSKAVENGKAMPMTPEESRAQADYEAQEKQCLDRARTADRARLIGLTFQGLAFALVGAATGQYLAESTEARSTPTPA